MPKYYREIVGPPSPEHKMPRIQQAVGKTISAIEYGAEESHPDVVHESEVVVFHFTDGTTMSITVGSNAGNLSSDHRDLKPGDFSTDLMPFWEHE